MNTRPLNYLLIFRDSDTDAARALSPEQRQHLLQAWNRWYDVLTAEGKLQQGSPLDRDGRIVTAATGRIVDGPFAEAKESVGGFFMLSVANLEEATAIARQCPGLPHGISVEVRPVANLCPVLNSPATSAAPRPRS